MNEPTIDQMSRELGTARRWATRMAEHVWQLEDAIDRHRKMVRAPVAADVQLYDVRDDDV